MKRRLIIPARGGSKRLPNKNIKKLNNKPLVFYTIDAAISSKKFDEIIFSSEDEKILKIVEAQFKNQVFIHQRPDYLAVDNSKVIDTVIELIDKYNDQTWLSLPTSPLKIKSDFENAVDKLNANVDGVISVTEMEFPPSLGILMDDKGYIKDYHDSKPWQTGNTRSQDHPNVLRPNGAIYGMWTKKLIKSKSFYKGKIIGHHMPRERSIDIDNQFDFDFAEFLLKFSNEN
jgi:CMP-N,N'-diacetyllegionaminic acid synthase